MAQAANKLYSRGEIRKELMDLWRQQIGWKNEHLRGYGIAHTPNCKFCERMEGRKEGLICAIRRFGGRPRG